MNGRYLIPLVLLTGFCAQGAPPVSSAAASMVDTYCSDCHNGSTRSPSGVLLDQFDASRVAGDKLAWSKAYRELQAGTMPPVAAPRPDRATYDAVLSSLDRELIAEAGKPHAASGEEIATRLAKLLWNAEPDASLLEDARRNKLSDPSTLDRQIRRMLADNRAEAFVSRFFFVWLQLDTLPKLDPNKKIFPDYDVSLRDSLAKETQLFLLSQLRDDRDPIELWSAKYTFLNEQLAKHYGIASVSGPQFRRVDLTKPERDGLLGQGSIMMINSRMDSGYSSPASRSVWIRKHFLGIAPPNPFPGAKPVKPELPITPQVRLLPADPCENCHRNFFPLGYALENFDALGGWRTHDQMGPVDASGSYVDGSPASGVTELRQVLLQRPDAFRTTITERLIEYASTGTVKSLDGSPESLARARQILSGMDKPRWSAIIAGVVKN